VAITKRVLGQQAPGGTSQVDLYTVGSGKQTTTSSLVVANRSATPTRFRVSVAPAGAADAPVQYLFYDTTIEGNDTFIATIGLTLGSADKVRVYAELANLSFHLFGAEEDVS
jgi:hypothetical protein